MENVNQKENKNKNKEPNNRLLMYMHAGSGNHGCEAIVRGLCEVLSDVDIDIDVLSHKPEEDTRYDLDEVCNVIATKHAEKSIITKTWFYTLRKILGNADALMQYTYSGAKPLNKYPMAISIGGDNYCYEDALFGLFSANHMFEQIGVLTALVGCSIEPSLLSRIDVIEDLRRYSIIVARESITYNALCEKLDNSKVFLAPDPAFALRPKECKLPERFVPGHTIAINVSPMILNYESSKSKGITISNYEKLVKTILEETEDMVLLVPHVITASSDDRKAINILFDKVRDYSDRIIIAEDHQAEELKYIISKCRLLIAARTHATIAAYSTCVPTLVVGYSVKSRGIAMDLFGTTEGYVLPVQELTTPDDLSEAYRRFEETAMQQKKVLQERIPSVIDETRKIKEYLYNYIR